MHFVPPEDDCARPIGHVMHTAELELGANWPLKHLLQEMLPGSVANR